MKYFLFLLEYYIFIISALYLLPVSKGDGPAYGILPEKPAIGCSTKYPIIGLPHEGKTAETTANPCPTTCVTIPFCVHPAAMRTRCSTAPAPGCPSTTTTTTTTEDPCAPTPYPVLDFAHHGSTRCTPCYIATTCAPTDPPIECTTILTEAPTSCAAAVKKTCPTTEATTWLTGYAAFVYRPRCGRKFPRAFFNERRRGKLGFRLDPGPPRKQVITPYGDDGGGLFQRVFLGRHGENGTDEDSGDDSSYEDDSGSSEGSDEDYSDEDDDSEGEESGSESAEESEGEQSEETSIEETEEDGPIAGRSGPRRQRPGQVVEKTPEEKSKKKKGKKRRRKSKKTKEERAAKKLRKQQKAAGYIEGSDLNNEAREELEDNPPEGNPGEEETSGNITESGKLNANGTNNEDENSSTALEGGEDEEGEDSEKDSEKGDDDKEEEVVTEEGATDEGATKEVAADGVEGAAGETATGGTVVEGEGAGAEGAAKDVAAPDAAVEEGVADEPVS